MPYLSQDEADDALTLSSMASTLLQRVLEEAINANTTDDYIDDNYTAYDNDDTYYDAGYDKKAKGPVYLDYSVLSIGILTLGLVLFVEISRHWIDHQAHGKPFFNAVLLMLYSELATLGIVEFAVFLLIKYYDDLDKDKKEVFGDVHFALFYTAVFNAIQSTLTALFTRNASNRLWVRTEQLELDHYVEIREEYDRVQSIIDAHQCRNKLEKWIRNLLLFVRHPGLRGKFNNLRVQVRFHELRLQFLETHNLPLNLKVSDYLKRSELGVLIGLVHISGTAWLFLTGGLALLYFVLGMVGYKTADVDVLGSCMTAVFFGMLFLFIIVSVALQFKMERIFQHIMKMKIDISSDYAEGTIAQKKLFWFGSPSLVVSFIQFNNFSYAIALAVVIMYWPYLTLVEPYWYLIAVFGCYAIFLYNLSVLLPQFTLCTSLGYLTNQKQLQETLAHHRLEEAQRQQRRRMIEKAIKHDSVIVLATHEESTEPLVISGSSGVETPSTVASVLQSTADGIIPVDDPKVTLLADLVKSDTTSLRNQLPSEAKESLLTREQSIRNRRSSRRKAVSDGVAAMRAFSSGSANGPLTTLSAETKKPSIESRRHVRKKTLSQPGLIKGWQGITDTEQSVMRASMDDADAERQRLKSNSESGVIKAWQDSQSFGNEDSAGHFNSLPQSGPKFVKKDEEHDNTPKWKKERAARLEGRRQARKKSQSASAVIQSWQDFSVKDSAPKSSGVLTMGLLPGHSEDSTEKDAVVLEELDEPVVSEPKSDSRVSFAQGGTDSLKRDEMLASETAIVDLADAVIVEEGETLPAPPSKASKAGTHTDDAEETESVASDKSIGNLSDVDIFESTRGLINTRNIAETIDPLRSRLLRHLSPSILARDARLYFLGPSYPSVSHVFGTLIVFFIIGHRVEAFVAKSGFIIQVDSFGWATNLLNMYWSIVVWLVCFVIADLMILMLFPLRRCKGPHEKTLAISALIDLLLTGTVMILLFVAEAQRCCTEDGDSTGIRMLADKIGLDYEFEDECTCGQWGSRTYSGLGIIEPFTSIIALRIFRFVFAARLVQAMETKNSKEIEESSQDTDKDQSSDPHLQNHGEHGHEDHSHGHGHGHGGPTALELWEGAIAQYPEIVEKHGIFSGELLQAMLGLHVDVDSSEDVATLSQGGSTTQETREENAKIEDSDNPETWQSHIKLTGTQYTKLAPEVQGLIIAGRLGKPVKLMHAPVPIDKNLPSGILPTVDEGTTDLTQRDAGGLAEFEVDNDKMTTEINTEFSFIAPFGRLVRSMRRCDRRHLPLLTKWVSVDVVMTQFEIVYFESKQGEASHEDEILISALNATRGGKGLRLCDVARGRKVVGHLDLADVTEVHVEQDDSAVSDVSLLEKAAERYHSKNDIAVEYWMEPSKFSLESEPKRFARAIRWTIMKEERLKLTTSSGVLVLRFYSDLECAELEKIGNTAAQHSLSKDIALQWAETVARICGPEQLQQELPHFAQNNDEELLDLLETVPFHNKEAERARKNRGKNELQYLYGEGGDPSTHLSDPSSPKVKKSVLGRPKSFGETEGTGSERSIRRPRMKSFRRAVSMGGEGGDDADSKIQAPSLV